MSDAVQAVEAYAAVLWAATPDREQAYKALCDSLYSAEELQDSLDAFVWDCVQNALRRIIDRYASAGRSGSANHHGAAPQKDLDPTMVARWGASVAAGFNFMLPSGVKLGDATRNEVNRAADHFAVQSKEALWKCKWLRLIAQGLPEGRTVRDQFKQIRLTELAISVEKEKSPEGVS